MSVTFEQFDREEFRQRVAKMTDSELIQCGEAAGEMCKTEFGQPPLQAFVIQLEECRAEWRRRHPRAKDDP
jgi:hypothetical protein